MKKDTEFEFFLEHDFRKYSSKWVAISGKKIISSGKSIKKTMTEARKKSKGKETLYARIQNKHQPLIL